MRLSTDLENFERPRQRGCFGAGQGEEDVEQSLAVVLLEHDVLTGLGRLGRRGRFTLLARVLDQALTPAHEPLGLFERDKPSAWAALHMCLCAIVWLRVCLQRGCRAPDVGQERLRTVARRNKMEKKNKRGAERTAKSCTSGYVMRSCYQLFVYCIFCLLQRASGMRQKKKSNKTKTKTLPRPLRATVACRAQRLP